MPGDTLCGGQGSFRAPVSVPDARVEV